MKNCQQLEWIEHLDNDPNAVIIDCRTKEEWDQGIINGSILLDLLNPQEFMNEAEKLDKEKNYYIYCRSGVRSITACQILESLGIRSTNNLLGGIISWQGELVAPGL